MWKLKDILREEAGDGGDGGGGGDNAPPDGEGSIFAAGGDPVSPATPADPVVTDTREKPKGEGDGQGMAKAYYDGLYDASGKIDKTKLDALPSDLKKHKALFERYDSMDGLLKGFANHAALAGRKGDLSAYERPGDDASDKAKEDHALFLKVANGVPDDPAGYGIEKPEGMDQKEWDASPVKDYLGTLHKHNASPELAKDLFAMNQAIAEKAQNDAAEAWTSYAKAEMNSLRTEFKTELPEVRALAERTASRFGLDESALRSAAAVKAFHAIGKAIGEDRMPSHGSDPHGGITDRQKALSIVNDKSNPMYAAYHNANHPQHQEAVDLRSSLNKRWAESQSK